MSFVEWQYPLLLVVTYLLYWNLPHLYRVYLLIGASYYFYACWDVRFLALLIATTSVDYLCGLSMKGKQLGALKTAIPFLLPGAWLSVCSWIPDVGILPPWLAPSALGLGAAGFFAYKALWLFPDSKRKKAFLAFSLCANLLILGFFKYYGFFVGNFALLLEQFGFHASLPLLEILLPVGISFYTFQSLSYVIDVYRGETKPCTGFHHYSAYISFFPQLVAGPIERSTTLLPQITSASTWEKEHLSIGCRLILSGYFKKVFVADNCAVLANYVFEPGTPLNAQWAILGVLAFAFQIYGDFSGYSDIARGSARLFGISLQQNFKFPYFAISPSDFWRRWHVSLSSWFRDYVYIPLGGNRSGQMRTLANLLLTMLLAGLWHGASWNFVLWGAFHGLLLAVYHTIPAGLSLEGDSKFPLLKRLPAMGTMFLLTLVGWALFRTQDPGHFYHWLQALGNWDPAITFSSEKPYKYLLVFVSPLLFLQLLSLKFSDEVAFGRFHWGARGAIYTLMIILIASSAQTNHEFIYFQF